MNVEEFEWYTPGPWQSIGEDWDDWDTYVRSKIGDKITHVCRVGINDKQTNNANARLIAAAPDLLAEVVRLRAEVAKLQEALLDAEVF